MSKGSMDEDTKKNPLSIKTTLIGDSGVGKTCIIRRYISNDFSFNLSSTNGVSYSKKELIIDNKKIQLDIWDTAGQEEYRSLGKHFYKDSYIVLLIYNIAKRESFDNLKNIWYEDLLKYGEEYKVLAVVGNKCDLYEQEAVPEEEARQFADEKNALFMNVSAKNGDNIDLLFESCLKKYFDPSFQFQIEERKKADLDSIIIRKSKRQSVQNYKRGCCS